MFLHSTKVGRFIYLGEALRGRRRKGGQEEGGTGERRWGRRRKKGQGKWQGEEGRGKREGKGKEERGQGKEGRLNDVDSCKNNGLKWRIVEAFR
jgi:hypothetical protein